LLNAVIIMIN